MPEYQIHNKSWAFVTAAVAQAGSRVLLPSIVGKNAGMMRPQSSVKMQG
jgi:hypothetical protein